MAVRAEKGTEIDQGQARENAGIPNGFTLTEDDIAYAMGQSSPNGRVQAPIWMDNKQTGQYLGSTFQNKTERITNTQQEVYDRVFKLSGELNRADKNSGYNQLVRDLVNVGALYTVETGQYVESTADAMLRAVKSYEQSSAAKDMPFNTWLAQLADSGKKIAGADDGGGGSGGGGGGGGGPFTNVTTALSNENDTESYLNAALGEFLGREATDKEIARFQKALNKKEARNPTIDKGVSGASGTTATRLPGFSGQEQMAKEFAQSRTDYAETTAATTLMDIMESAITESGPQKKLEGFIDDGTV